MTTVLPLVRLSNATDRNTQCHWVRLFDVNTLFSYQTPVAFMSYGKVAARRNNIWGPTTGRHLHETGCSGYKIVDDANRFNELLNQTIFEAIAEHAAHTLEANHALA